MNQKPKIIEEAELEEIKNQLEYEKKKKNSQLNFYEIYIGNLIPYQVERFEQYKDKTIFQYEKHHITPLHAGGSNDPQNILLVTIKEHVTAHWIRFQVLNTTKDKTAYLFRIGNTEEAVELQKKHVLEARELDRQSKVGFFNTDFQTEMGKGGGSKGGSANTKKQFEARQKVGQKYGKKVGIGNQKNDTKSFLLTYSIWSYKKGNEEVFCCISRKESFSDLLNCLEEIVPNTIQVKTPMYKLISSTPGNSRKQMYGWKIVNKLIRSEVGEGCSVFAEDFSMQVKQYIENFKAVNPGKTLQFDQASLNSYKKDIGLE